MERESSALPVAALAGGVLLGFLLAASLHAPQRLIALARPGRSPHQLDGRVLPGEYRFQWHEPASKLSFAWSISGDRLLGAVSTPDTGWVAVGFGGEGPLMYGADIVIGFVDGRGAHLRDHFAASPTSHEPDTALGGRDDILAGAGLQTADGTTIEFERPLAAHDSTDRAIESGETHVIVASSEAEDFMAYHIGGRKAVAQLDLFAGPPATHARAAVLPDHLTDVQIMLATWMTLLLLVAVHGFATRWAQGDGAAGEGPVSALVVLIGLMVLIELAALGTFAVGVAVAAPTWLVGSALALGLAALGGLVVLYSRAFVRWELVQGERDDGIPW